MSDPSLPPANGVRGRPLPDAATIYSRRAAQVAGGAPAATASPSRPRALPNPDDVYRRRAREAAAGNGASGDAQ